MKKIQAAILVVTILLSFNAFSMEEYNANNCELYVDGFAETYGSYNNMGLWSRAIRSEIKVVKSDSMKRIIKVGQWIKKDDGSHSIVTDNNFLSLMLYKNFYDEYSDKWIIEVPFEGSEYAGSYGGGYGQRFNYEYEIVETAYFVDIERTNGDYVRIWLSNNGQNFKPSDNLSKNTHHISNGPTYIKWADQSSSIFTQKHLCAK